jgi:hypothetical protein
MANARIQYGRGPGSLNKEKLDQIKTQAGFGSRPRPILGPQKPFGPENNNPYSFRR